MVEDGGSTCILLMTGLALALLLASASLAVGMTLGAALILVVVGIGFAGHTVKSCGTLTGLTSLETF